MKITHLLAGLALALFLGLARANEAPPLAEDPLVEKRLIAISEELRCLVCQNESLAGSRADLANDLRREIRSMIKEGQSDTQIMEFMVSRYGDFVRYRPPVNATTWLLWGGPFLLLLVGIGALIYFLRRRTIDVPATSLSADEQRRAQALLNNTDPHA
jgi:cytochrome c-type biogenesis protein CcmH